MFRLGEGRKKERERNTVCFPTFCSFLSCIFLFSGIQIPHVVAGDNLDMPVVGRLLKSAGAVYIRREWGGDELYKTVLEEYMATLLSEGSE